MTQWNHPQQRDFFVSKTVKAIRECKAMGRDDYDEILKEMTDIMNDEEEVEFNQEGTR